MIAVNYRIGLISDTHGLLRPEAKTFLRGCNAIVHGGDIGRAEILAELGDIAPVTAVRGNNDVGAWADGIAHTATVRFGQVALYAIHDIAQLVAHRLPVNVRVVVCGHSHKPRVQTREGVLHVNPGSAGPRRFKLPIAVAQLRIEGDKLLAQVVDLTQPGFPVICQNEQ